MEFFTPQESAASILIHVIEYFSDGFLILNEKKEILLVNDALLRMLGQRSTFFIDHNDHIVSCLPLTLAPYTEQPSIIPVGDGRRYLFSCVYFCFTHDKKKYFVVKLTPAMSIADTRSGRTLNIVEELGEPAVTYDQDGIILAMNDSFLDLLSFRDDKKPVSYSALHMNPEAFSMKLSQVNSSKRLRDIETSLKPVTGQAVIVLETVRTIENDAGMIAGYVSSFRDITKVKHLEDQLKTSQTNYRRLFEIVTAPVIVLDKEGRLVNMNVSAEQLYRCRRDEMIGTLYDSFFRSGKKRPDFATLLCKARERGGKYAEIGTPRRRSDGSLIYTYATYTVVEHDEKNPFAFFIMEKDLTARIKLEKRLEDTLKRVRETQAAAILGFARITEYRDHTTGNHLRRIMLYTELLARSLKKLPKYREYMKGDYIESISLSAVLHDIGKVGIEDSILLKPGKLTHEEYERMKQHTALGGDALRAIDRELSYESFLTIGKEVAWYHHERWDGTGYPEGRKGEDIPLSARIVALADVYDALTSERVYKSAVSHEDTVTHIISERGKHFDPDVVEVFLSIHGMFQKIREQFSDRGKEGSMGERPPEISVRKFSSLDPDPYPKVKNRSGSSDSPEKKLRSRNHQEPEKT